MSQEAIRPRPAEGAYVIPLAGELDIAAVETLKAQAATALDRPGTRALIFDMTAVAFIDAAAISALVDIRNRVPVQVTNVSVRILRVLTLVGVAEYLGASSPIVL